MAYDGTLLFGTGIDTGGFQNDVSGLVSLGTKAAAAVTATFTAASAAAIKVGSDFEASMSQVAATMGITADTSAFDMLSEAAKEMGETTKFSASQAGEALNYLALAGYDAEKAVAALPTVLNVAAAGGMELADASDMVTDAMSALGLETSQMSDFADKLAVTSQKSNTSVAQLGQAILTVGGTAKSLSGGVTELNTALGILADNGIKGAEGGTMLRNIILSLSAPTDKAAEAITGLGITAFDAQGNLRPLQDVFYDLNTAMSSLSQQEQNAVLTKIFNKEDLKGVNALLGTSAERFDELSGYISDCKGAAEQMAETMNDNLQGDLTILGSALEGLGVAAYEKFQVPMRTAVQEVTGSVGDLTESLTNGELSESMDKVAASLGDITGKVLSLMADDVLPALINCFAWIVDNAGTIAPILVTAASAVAAYKVSVLAATTAVNAATAAHQLFKAVVSANPYVLAALAVGTLTAAVVTHASAVEHTNKTIAEGEKVYAEQTEAVNKLKESYDDVKEAAQSIIDERENEISNLEALKKHLDDNVDADGKIIGNYETVKQLVSELNEIYNEEISIIDGRIEGYNNLSVSIDKYIESLRNETLLEAKKDVWEKALVVYEEASAKDDELLKNMQEATDKYTKASEKYERAAKGVNDFSVLDEQAAKEAGYSKVIPYLRDQMLLVQGERDAAQQAYNENRALMNQSLADIDDYENALREKARNTEYKSPQQMAAEEYAKNYTATMQQQANEIAEAQDEINSDLASEWKRLDYEYAMGVIASDKNLYAQRSALLKEYGDENNEEHWSYFEKLHKMEKDFAEQSAKVAKQAEEDRKKAAKKAVEEEKQVFKDKWNGIARLEQLGLLTEQDALEERRKLFKENFSDFDPEKDYLSDAYDYYVQIYEDETEFAKAALNEQEKVVDKGLSDILKRYQDAYSELESKRENYRKKLLSIGGDIFSVEETKDENGNKRKTYTVNNIDEQIRKMREYHSQIKDLKKQGVSDGLLGELTSMNTEDSAQFAKYLSGMSGAEFKKINDLYKEKDAVAKELSEDLYKSEAQKISDSMTMELADLAVSAYDYGAQTAEKFLAGFNDSVDKLGIDALYGQYQAAGATKIYENYAAVSNDDREFSVTVDVTGKSNVYVDGTVLGTIVTNHQAKQKAKKGG